MFVFKNLGISPLKFKSASFTTCERLIRFHKLVIFSKIFHGELKQKYHLKNSRLSATSQLLLFLGCRHFHSWKPRFKKDGKQRGEGGWVKRFNFRNFYQKRGGSDFSHKKGSCLRVSLIFVLINLFQCHLSLTVFSGCVFCLLFTPFSSELFVFHRKNLVLQHLINRYDFCK